MWISRQAIRRPVVTVVLTLVVVFLGVMAFARLPTDEFPDVKPRVVRVTAVYPGASPEAVSREVTGPIEEALAGLRGAEETRSTAIDGLGLVAVFFDFDRDPVEATQDVRDRLSAIRARLPPEMSEPVVSRWDPLELPVLSLALTSAGLDAAALTRVAEGRLVPALRAVPGVAEVRLVGGVERELTVELLPEALEAHSVPVAQVVQVLQAENLAAPVGRVSDRLEDRTIRLRGRLERPADFEQVAIGQHEGQIVRLGDLARVRDGRAEARSAALHDGDPAVGLDVMKAPGASATAVAAAVRDAIARLRPGLAAEVDLTVVRDGGARVAEAVGDVQASLWEGAILTVLVVFLFLRSWRSTVITAMALPISVIASFIAVWAAGYSLNTMSLLGLSLAIGILIDDAIVVRENIVRHMEAGSDHATAAREGTAEIGLAVAATTFSVVIVFVPIGFMGGLAGQWVRPFALTVAASVLVSLLVSFSIDPMLSAIWPDPALPGRSRAPRRDPLSRLVGPLHRGLDRVTGWYARQIRSALRRPGRTALVAIGSFLLALAIPAAGWVGTDFIPPADRDEIDLVLECPAGSSLAFSVSKASALARRVGAMPEVAHSYAAIGAGIEGAERGELHVRLVPSSGRDRSADQVADRIREAARRLGGIRAARVAASGRARQLEVNVTGPDPRVLARLSERVAGLVAAAPGAIDVVRTASEPKRELDVVLDRDLAGALGVSARQVAQMLRPAFAGLDAGDWIDPDGQVRDVTVRLAADARRRPEDVEALAIVVPGGPGAPPSVVRLGQIADVRSELGPVRIDHLDGQPVIAVGANATAGRPLSDLVRPVEDRLDALRLPPGYQARIGGDRRDQEDVFGRLAAALAIAVPLMYVVLVIQFGSFLDPIPIIASLPLALCGAVLALLVTGATINLMSMTGVVLLMGTVAKNAILLIDFARRAERRGLARQAALVEAVRARLRPIAMTSVAIVAGMVPVALGLGAGGELRAPLGQVVIGGVVTSTVLTLLVVPVLYDLLAGWRARFAARVSDATQVDLSPALPDATVVTSAAVIPLRPLPLSPDRSDDDATSIWIRNAGRSARRRG